MAAEDRQEIAMVAGGSAGIGLAVTEALLEKGYSVAILARGEDRLKTLEERHGDALMGLACDVSKSTKVLAAANTVKDSWGAPTLWVNCAMLTAFSPFENMTATEFSVITDTTYIGQVNGCRAALDVMTRGRIINIGSGLSYRSVPFQSAYCGAKHAINGFSAALRCELLRKGSEVKLSLIQLPAVNTPQFDWARNRMMQKPQPAPPIYQPSLAAKGVLKAIETDAREIFVGKSVFQLVFGNMVLPDFLDRKLADSGVSAQKSDVDDDSYTAGNLTEPADHSARAIGSYSGRAKESGLILDADFSRKLVFSAPVVAAFLLGLLLG